MISLITFCVIKFHFAVPAIAPPIVAPNAAPYSDTTAPASAPIAPPTNEPTVEPLLVLSEAVPLSQNAIYIDIDIFVNCNWVKTRWQWYSTHLHTNNTVVTGGD